MKSPIVKLLRDGSPLSYLVGTIFVAGIGLVIIYINHSNQELIDKMAHETAAAHASALSSFRTLYTSQVVEKVRRLGISVSHDDLGTDSIPLPATLTLRLAEQISQSGLGGKAQLYSPYPFPWRKRKGLSDPFAKEAWKYLNKHKNGVYSRFTTLDGVDVLRYGTADLMRESCVQCHNSHPDTPKSDWKVGDVRGVLEVSVPIGQIVKYADTQRWITYILVLVTSLIGAVGFFALKKLGKSKKVLREQEEELKVKRALETEISERRQTEHKLKRSQDELRSLSHHLVSIQEKERTHIAREIHDEFGQNLTALQMDLNTLKKTLPSESKRSDEIMNRMGSVILRSIKSVRRLASSLRPGALDDLGLIAAMEWQTKEFQNRTGIRCTLSTPDDDVILDPFLSNHLFRIFQESLTNVARHSKATRVKIYLIPNGDRIRLSIQDNGIGATQKEIERVGSLGIIGMRERVRAMGGQLDVQSKKNGGTLVQASIPLMQEFGNEEATQRNAKANKSNGQPSQKN